MLSLAMPGLKWSYAMIFMVCLACTVQGRTSANTLSGQDSRLAHEYYSRLSRRVDRCRDPPAGSRQGEDVESRKFRHWRSSCVSSQPYSIDERRLTVEDSDVARVERGPRVMGMLQLRNLAADAIRAGYGGGVHH